MNSKEMTGIYDTLMCIPGMSESVKIDVKVSRKNVLLLSNAIHRGIQQTDNTELSELLDVISKDSRAELIALADEFLLKAGLTELNQKLVNL